MSSSEEEGFSWGSFFSGPLPGKLAALVGLIVVSRIGVYVRIPGVDVDAFSAAMQSNGLLGYVDALSGGSISKVSKQGGTAAGNPRVSAWGGGGGGAQDKHVQKQEHQVTEVFNGLPYVTRNCGSICMHA
jgi:hypothetical protein